MAAKSLVVGIDLGACESYVAYVGKGIVDIVQNEVSKRATPTIVGFTDRERLLGDAALSQIRSNAKNSCRNFKHLLGRKVDAADVQPEHFWSTSKLCECADGHAGYDVTYKGEQRQMSAVEVTAMYLTKLRDVTETWCQGKVSEAVIAVPSSFSDVQRQAVLDAAAVANLKVLRLMNEHTATALAYGIYRSNDFDPEKPMTVAFCSMGISIFSVSIVQFLKGKLTVVCERSDKVGGRALDECLMREFSAQFKKKHGCDPLTNKKAAFKLEDAVMKCKKILSANSEAPISVECLMEDEDFASQITRADLEDMCKPAMEKTKAVLDAALAASGMTPDQIDSVEIVGGGSRVPWVKKLCSDAFGGKDLSTTMNQEESVSRGCALQAAILSPLYKVRDFEVHDISPFPINIGWIGQVPPAADAKDDDGEKNKMQVEGESKSSTIFPAGSPMDVLKSLTFFRKGSFDIKAEYTPDAALLPLTPRELGTWSIEVPPQAEAKKVKVKARLTLHGMFAIEGAQLVEEEEYEEVVKEKRELPAEPKEDGTPAPPSDADAEMKQADGNKTEAKPADGEEGKGGQKNGEPAQGKDSEKKFEWVEVKHTKKRVKRTDLKVVAKGRPGLSTEAVQKLMDAETAMQAEMREIIETDEKRNDLESYILTMRSRIEPGAEYGDFISAADREAFGGALTKAEDWLYDTFDATKASYIEKLEELQKVGDAVAWRKKESGMRAEWIQAVTGTVSNYRSVAATPGDKFAHVPAEKLASIVSACDELEKWLKGTREKQDALAKHEKPVLLCAEMEKKSQDLAQMADEILKKAKPAPPKEEAKEDQKSNGQTIDVDMGESKGESETAKAQNDMDVD
eukprot:CAMPEP_0115201196 /NCGR_PEP_ID=MMETSP0270-20121206/17502_1 /TAXON_ID=71861 /ORGANISM="Scrippsiella trochoidea, Strain CCMP3099" /LENGTH=853 /DNA_ID=CAMNT_0002614603 /DNA_START=55 /DNA_END=2616 /DNA_ORIENTATION=+